VTLLPFFEWLDHTGVSDMLRNSQVLYTSIEIIHLLGLALLAGTILIVDIGLLGFGMRRQPVSRIAEGLAPWTAGAMVVMAITGPVLLSSQALKCYYSHVFWVKMGLLLLAVLFHFTVHRRAIEADSNIGPRASRLAGGLSLTLWIATAWAAKWIEFA
jgi:hypothetical protein